MFPFTHDCTACERRQLVFPSMVTAVTRTSVGAHLTLTCWCGAEQTHHLGRAPEPYRVAA